MIRRYLAPALLALIASTAVQAQVNALPPSRHILVYGDAEARAIPDRFKITINLEVVDPVADVARAKVESHLRATLAGLEKAGVPAGEIVATAMKIEPRNRYDGTLSKQVYEGVAVSRELSARFSSAESLQAFLGGLDSSEQVQVSGVETELTNEAELNAQLRAKSIEDAKRKAEAIAGSFGVRLGGLYSVSDVAPQFQYGVREGNWAGSYEWDRSARSGQLKAVTVTGTRLAPETLRTGYVTYTDKIYAVFLIAE